MIEKTVIKEFIHRIFKYKYHHIGAAICSVIYSICILIQPVLLMKIVDYGIAKGDINFILKYIIFYILLLVVECILDYFTSYLYAVIGKNFTRTLRIDLLKHIERLPGSYKADINMGELFTIYDRDIDNVESISSKLLFTTIIQVVTSIFMCSYLLFLQPSLFFLVVIIQPLVFFTQKHFNKRIVKLTEETRICLSNMVKNVNEFFRMLLYGKSLGFSEYFWKKYFNHEREYSLNSIKINKEYSKEMNIINFLNGISTIIIYGIGGLQIIYGNLTIGALITFNQYSQKLFSPIIRIVENTITFKKAKISIYKIMNILNERTEYEVRNGKKSLLSVTKGVSFNNITFSYNGVTSVLDNFSISFPKGAITGIVGESGGGKSTIINLLLRNWTEDSGSIKIDENDINNYTLKSIRENISIVTQEIVLLNDTIYNNLTMLNSKIKKQQVDDILDVIQMSDFIKTLPNGLDTEIGEGGVKLSGGQRQRIAIGRALLRDSKVIIFDEATSSLDNNCQELIMENLYSQFENKVVIIIAHRLSTIKKCDEINVFKNGKIIERGTYKELMAKMGELFRMENK